MAEYISFQPSDFFNTTLYDGTAGTQTISGVGFQPDFTWLKARSESADWGQFDAVRGATKDLSSNNTNAESTLADSLTSWNSDGFVMGSGADFNASGQSYGSWNWKAGTTTGIATDGSTTITPSAYSFNQTAGISILAYTGNVTSGAKLAHGLGAVPKMIIIKNYNSASEGWSVYHEALGNTKYIKLNTTATAVTSSSRWNDTTPDAVNITLGDDPSVNGSTTMVAYCFAPKKGYSKFGSYVANNNSDGPFIYTGFRPNLVFMKNYVNGAWSWQLLDCRREGYNSSNDQLYPNTSAAEGSDGYGDLFSNGFKITTGNAGINDSGATFIYAAFAEFPIVSSNDIPGVAR